MSYTRLESRGWLAPSPSATLETRALDSQSASPRGTGTWPCPGLGLQLVPFPAQQQSSSTACTSTYLPSTLRSLLKSTHSPSHVAILLPYVCDRRSLSSFFRKTSTSYTLSSSVSRQQILLFNSLDRPADRVLFLLKIDSSSSNRTIPQLELSAVSRRNTFFPRQSLARCSSRQPLSTAVLSSSASTAHNRRIHSSSEHTEIRKRATSSNACEGATFSITQCTTSTPPN